MRGNWVVLKRNELVENNESTKSIFDEGPVHPLLFFFTVGTSLNAASLKIDMSYNSFSPSSNVLISNGTSKHTIIMSHERILLGSCRITSSEYLMYA